MAVVDRLVTVAPEQLVGAVVAERRDRGRVNEPNSVVGIHDPDRLRGRLQHGGEEILGTDIQPFEVGEGAWHAKPPSTSSLRPVRGVKSRSWACRAFEHAMRRAEPPALTAGSRALHIATASAWTDACRCSRSGCSLWTTSTPRGQASPGAALA